MNGMRKNKLTVLLSSIMAGTVLMSACSVNVDGIGNAFSELGNNLNTVISNQTGNGSVQPEATETVVIETSIDETTETTETIAETEPEVTATPTPTAVPSPTATPSPTPVPQRVDFSDLTEDELSGTITVEDEAFSESAHATDDDDIVLAEFTGNRMLLSSEEDSAPVTSVNLMLDAFYLEAEGVYNRIVNEQYAAYELDPDTTPDTITVFVEYQYYFNGRLLGVKMSYGQETEEQDALTYTEYITFDLYTGQIVFPDMLFNDIDALYAKIAQDIADETPDRRDTAEDYEIIFIGTELTEDGEMISSVIVATEDGEDVYTADMADYSDYLTRYARIVFDISAAPSEDEAEEDDEPEAEETEETEETESDEESDQTVETETEETEQTER